MQNFNAIQTLALAHLGFAKTAILRNDMTAARSQLTMVTGSENRIAAAEAQYLIGESYARVNDDERAVTEFLKVQKSYADYPEWVAPAILQAAQANERQNRFDEARALYKSIVDNYPFAGEAFSKSKERLEELAGK